MAATPSFAPALSLTLKFEPRYELTYGPYTATDCVAQNRSCSPARESDVRASNCAVRCKAAAGVGSGHKVWLRVLPSGAHMCVLAMAP